jgi:GNAT superfamily N-acetyltransferase
MTNSEESKTVIRKGAKPDVARAFELVMELATYERSAHEVSNTIARMEEDGFGSNPIFEFYVAVVNGEILGISLFYYRYSTWKGKRLYLEDIVVTEKSRGKALGTLLFEKTLEHAKQNKCTGMMWQVLDWNTPAINFYEKYGTTFDNGWYNCHLDV